MIQLDPHKICGWRTFNDLNKYPLYHPLVMGANQDLFHESIKPALGGYYEV